MDVSIIIPTRDRAAWLPTCLAHLEQQTFPAARFEIIVVDDGSADDTSSVLQRYAQGAPVRIRPIRTERVGFAAARNKGVTLATGTMLLFFAEDELASPRIVENHWRAHGGDQVEVCLAGEIHVHPQLSPDSFTRLSIDDSPDDDEYAEQVSYFDAQSSNFSIGRTIFERIGGFDEVEGLSPLEHIVLAHRLGKEGVEIRRLADARSYVWQPASLPAERVRYYDMGYAMFEVLRMSRSAAIVERHQLNRGPIERTLSAFLVPYYLRAFERNNRENHAFASALRRRILHHDRAVGFNDAAHGRPRHAPAPAPPAR
ncbi:MAG: glycosyltransferase [Candidatus Hydrogenedentes bacterium]|nr:glycosyltransferase [Candidatus Hydrogenedentota bacterium]